MTLVQDALFDCYVPYLEVPSPKAEFVLVVLAKYLAGKFVVELILSKISLSIGSCSAVSTKASDMAARMDMGGRDSSFAFARHVF